MIDVPDLPAPLQTEERLRAEVKRLRADLVSVKAEDLPPIRGVCSTGCVHMACRMVREARAEVERLREALLRYVAFHQSCADHHPDDCPGDCEPCAIDAAVDDALGGK